MKSILISFLILFSITLSAQTNKETNIKNWKVSAFPKNTDTLQAYAYTDTNCWRVYLKDSIVYVTNFWPPHHFTLPFFVTNFQDKEMISHLSPHEGIITPDGIFVSYRPMAHMKTIYWFSPDGKQHQQIGKILTGFLGFIKYENRLLTLSEHPGGLQEIKKENGNWIISTYIDFPLRPYAIQIDKNNFIYIATASAIFAVTDKKEFFTLIEAGMWAPYFTPASMAIKDNYIYLGMQKGVIRYDIDTDKQEWLLPD